jgi:hypothetical protein
MLPGKWTEKCIRQETFSELASQQEEKAFSARSCSSQSARQAEGDIAVLEAAASQLDKLDRYERRSISRRGRALKAFEVIKAASSKHL